MVPLAAFLLTAFAASTAMAQATPPAACPIERAVFRLKSTPDAATLRFIKAARHLEPDAAAGWLAPAQSVMR